MTHPHPPPENPGGQDTEPPDVRLAVRATITLLGDLQTHGLPEDLALRVAALRSVMRRLEAHLDHDDGRALSWWRALVHRR